LKGRFARSSIGAAWYILQPMAMAAIMALVLSEVLAAKLPGVASKGSYATYLLAGTAAWGLFAEVTNRCTGVFIEFASALKKISFPRLCLPVIVGGSALLTHVLLLTAVAVVCALFLDVYPGLAWFALLPGAVLILLFSYGLGVLLGVFNVFSRDVGQVFGIVLQLWFWLTPIVYPPSAMPASMQWLGQWNPMAPVVRIYQDAILLNAWPDWSTLVVPSLVALLLFGLSFVVFRRASPELVDAL
jgi:lipopolysaccharide transport system permease protein